jgi:hypothetical protein
LQQGKPRSVLPAFCETRRVHHCIHKVPLYVPILSQINPFHAPHPTSWKSIVVLSSHLCLGLTSGSFLHVSPPKTCTHFSSPHTSHMPRPSPARFNYPEKKLMRNGDHKSPPYVLFPIPLLSRPFWAKILFSAPYVRKQSTYIPPTMLERGKIIFL